jgi:hypothetical protein
MKITGEAQIMHYRAYFLQVKRFVLIMRWATFWVTFSQTRPVTLLETVTYGVESRG